MSDYMTTVRIYNDVSDKRTFTRQMVQDFDDREYAFVKKNGTYKASLIDKHHFFGCENGNVLHKLFDKFSSHSHNKTS